MSRLFLCLLMIISCFALAFPVSAQISQFDCPSDQYDASRAYVTTFRMSARGSQGSQSCKEGDCKSKIDKLPSGTSSWTETITCWPKKEVINQTQPTQNNTVIDPGSGFKVSDIFKEDPTKGRFGNIADIVSGFLNIAFMISGFLMFFWFAWGVFQYIFAGGNKESLAKARSRIIWAIVGFVIVVMAFTISRFVEEIFPNKVGTLTPLSVPAEVKK